MLVRPLPVRGRPPREPQRLRGRGRPGANSMPRRVPRGRDHGRLEPRLGRPDATRLGRDDHPEGDATRCGVPHRQGGRRGLGTEARRTVRPVDLPRRRRDAGGRRGPMGPPRWEGHPPRGPAWRPMVRRRDARPPPPIWPAKVGASKTRRRDRGGEGGGYGEIAGFRGDHFRRGCASGGQERLAAAGREGGLDPAGQRRPRPEVRRHRSRAPRQ